MKVFDIFRLNVDVSKRRFGLDVLRAFAIFLVLKGHGAFLLNNTFLEDFPWVRMIDGVDLFFVLSGLLIGSILLKASNEYQKLKPTELLDFWKRRWLRTLPNYYLILSVNWVLVKYEIIYGDLNKFSPRFLIFTQNFASPFQGFFWESWSLSVEEWFYIFLPLLLSILLIIFSPKKSFLLASLILILLPLLYRINISSLQADGFMWDITFRKTVLTRLDSIGYGILAAWIRHYYHELWVRSKYYSLIVALVAISVLLNVTFDPNSFYFKTFYFSLLPLSAMFLLPFADQMKQMKGRAATIITHLSIISYSAYLINLSIVSEVIKKNFPPASPIDALMKYILYWLIVWFASTLLYKFFEKPMMDLRDKKLKFGESKNFF